MNLGRVKTFLIILFLGINIYLICNWYISSRFFVSRETVQTSIDILSDYGIELKEETVLKHTVNLRNIDTSNIIYTPKFQENKSDIVTVDGNTFTIDVKDKSVSKKGERALKNAVTDYLEELGLSSGYMKYINKNGNRYIYLDIKGYEIFDSVISIEPTQKGFRLKGSWFEPMGSRIHSRSRERSTVYITSVLMSMTGDKEIMANSPFEITDIKYGYLAGKPYGDGAHVTATALPYYKITDSKGNTYYYDAQSGVRYTE